MLCDIFQGTTNSNNRNSNSKSNHCNRHRMHRVSHQCHQLLLPCFIGRSSHLRHIASFVAADVYGRRGGVREPSKARERSSTLLPLLACTTSTSRTPLRAISSRTHWSCSANDFARLRLEEQICSERGPACLCRVTAVLQMGACFVADNSKLIIKCLLFSHDYKT